MRFDDAVEAARLGTIFAHPKAQNQYRRWSQRRDAPKPVPLGDAALEAAILRIGQQFPGNVERVVA